MELNPLNLAMMKARCERSHLDFTRVFFKEREESKFLVNDHHDIISETLDKVYTGEINRLIINGMNRVDITFTRRGLVIA